MEAFGGFPLEDRCGRQVGLDRTCPTGYRPFKVKGDIRRQRPVGDAVASCVVSHNLSADFADPHFDVLRAIHVPIVVKVRGFYIDPGAD